MPIPRGLAIKSYPSSSYVYEAAYDDAAESIYVTYKDSRGRPTVTARYDHVPPSMWRAFQAAPSQGKWAVRNLHPLPYVLV